MFAPTFAAMSDVAALVLDDPSVASSEPRHFAGFPGLWALDEPVLVASLGFETEEDAYARVEELGLPLAATTMAAPVEEAEPGSLLDLNAVEAVAAVAELREPAELHELLELEAAGKNRKTVVAALADRLEQLQPAGEAG